MKRKINVLHLSDLHFGAENKEISPTASAQRKNALKALQGILNELENEWKPNIVVISGDIGWKGHENDYKDAKSWIEGLLKVLDLTANDLVLAVGNHDIEIKAATGMKPPTTKEEADDWLKIENLENFIRPFASYTNFHKTLGIPDLLMGDFPYQIIGCRELKEIKFIVLNSAWFSRGKIDKADKDNLWIGLPQLEVLRDQGCLLDESNYNQFHITIAVLHHPESWLNEAEQNSYEDRPGTYGFLSKGCHVILSGHTHSTIEPPDRKYNHAYLFTGGSTYTGSDYRNNFSILQIDIEARTLERKAFEFDPRQKKWVPRHDDTSYPLSLRLPSRSDAIRENKLKMKQTTYNYNLLRERAKDHARRYIEQKSRTIARTTTLPKIIERKVAVHNREEKIVHHPDGSISFNAKDNLAPFSEMVASVHPTFLFGDLGSGKSTLVGDYIVKLIEANLDLIPILIPARYFLNKKIDTAATLSKHVSNYVQNQLDTTQKNFELQTVLEDMQEVTLVIDGFDELDKELAQDLLLRTEDLVSHWSGLRAICTGRPIELRGLNYNNWQCLEMVSLTREEQKQLFLNEAFADGLEGDKAERDANDKMAFLESNPELLNIATTPLTVRLIRPHLGQSNQTKSIGDLLIDITQEQLGEWGDKDGKEKSLTQFKTHFPDAFSREALLGEIAAEIHNNPLKAINKDSLYAIISNKIGDAKNKNLAISQGCFFFENNILQKNMDILTSPSNPIFQCALGFYIFFKLKHNETIQLEGDKKALWREYSFAASLARRKSSVPKLRESFKAYIDDTFTDVGMSPAVAIIISESGDKELAQHFIEILKQFEFRPLRDFMDKNTADVVAYAHCFYLAGNIGFNWFYEEYLNPRYPYQMQWRNIEAAILTHWLIISDFKIKQEHMKKLRAIPKPLTASGSFQSNYILPVIVLISPEIFSARQRALLYVEHLNSRSYKIKAISLLEKEFEAGNKDEVLKALETVCSKENQSADAVSLWLKLCDEKPPLAIIQNIIYLSIFKRNEPLFIELAKRLGEKNLANALKWYLFDDSQISTAAALKLYDLGEKNLFLLGPGLLKGIHDGGKVDNAEYVLNQLIQKRGKDGLVWLLNQLPHSDGSFGPHSAYWRILLTALNEAEEIRTDWFAFAIQYLGMITIPRYPEIRREFKKLLDNKPDYKATLDDLLKSLNREHRYNAACILLTCYPATELLAAEIVIKGVEIHGSKEMDEWVRFCLRLDLGRKVLEHVSSIVESLHSYSKTFALTLLYHNGHLLSIDQYRDLVISLLDRSYTFDMDLKYPWKDDLPQILAQDKSFEILIEIIEKNNQLSQKAASKIWSHHQDKLEPQQYSHCLSLIIDSFNYWDLKRMDFESGRLKKDGLFRKQILSTTHQIKTSTGKEPIISIYLRAISETSAWKDLLWAAMFYDKYSGPHLEHSMFWLFDKGRKDSSIGKTIGSAAREFLSDPRVKEEKYYNERIPWLTFLAHEFGGLPSKEIENSLLSYRPIHTEITTALIARLGYVPDGFCIEVKDYYIFIKHYDRIKLDSPGFEHIVNITREAENIHPDFVQWVERVLLSGVLQDEEIKEIALTGRFGCLFSVLISFCRNSLTDYDWIIRLIGAELTGFNRHDRNNKSLALIRRARNAIPQIIANDPKRKDKYFERIKKVIKKGHHEKPVDLISEFLMYREIDREIFSILLSEISEHPYHLNRRNSRLLAEYFVQLKKEQKTFVLSEIKKIVSTLSHRVESSHAFTAGMDEMLFSLAVFLLQGKTDEESERVFLYGFQSIFIYYYKPLRQDGDTSIHFHAKDILNAIEPLLKEVPNYLIKRCIKRGMNSNIPEISSFCRVLNALS